MSKMIAAAVIVGLLSGVAAAAEKESSFMTFLRNLKTNLEKSAVSGERKKNRSASVASVRGENQASSLADPNEPALKGDRASRKAKKDAAEAAELEKGIDLLLAGKTDEGVKAVEAFKAAHPKSALNAKADEVLAQAKAAPKPEAEEAKAEAPAKP